MSIEGAYADQLSEELDKADKIIADLRFENELLRKQVAKMDADLATYHRQIELLKGAGE